MRSDSDYTESFDFVELNSIKSKLLSILAHDLGGSLTGTKSMLDLPGVSRLEHIKILKTGGSPKFRYLE